MAPLSRLRRTSPRKKRRPSRRNLLTLALPSRSNNHSTDAGRPSQAARSVSFLTGLTVGMNHPANLNRGGDFCYQIDSEVLSHSPKRFAGQENGSSKRKGAG